MFQSSYNFRSRISTVPLLLLILSVFLVTQITSSQSSSSDQSIFHEDEGHCVDANRLDRNSNRQINQILTNLLPQSTYLSIFSVALDNQCPFWQDDGLCVIRECSVDNCEENEVPSAWKNNPQDGKKCESKASKKLNAVDRSLPGLASLMGPPVYQVADSDAWTTRDDEKDQMYVDLRRNTEQYTGYDGPSSRKVWTAIYDENCFSFSDKCRSGICDPDACKEERVLYRLISGLHSSISMHIAKRFLNSTGWGVNTKIYKERIRKFPERIKNLHVAYAVVLRAIAKASKVLHPDNYPYITGNDENDAITRQGLTKLFSVPILQSDCEKKIFDESDMFLKNNKYLLPEFRKAFRNISTIMDCVGCEKCRLWGKLQFLGLGTSLRILFEQKTPELERNDVIALFNLMHKLSTSVEWLNKMESEIQREARIKAKGGALMAVIFIVLFALSVRASKQEDTRWKKQSLSKKQDDKDKKVIKSDTVEVKDNESLAPSQTESVIESSRSPLHSERIQNRKNRQSS